jgi:hypothetical protein
VDEDVEVEKKWTRALRDREELLEQQQPAVTATSHSLCVLLLSVGNGTVHQSCARRLTIILHIVSQRKLDKYNRINFLHKIVLVKNGRSIE